MSDIGIQFPWYVSLWFLVYSFLLAAFWPLTVAAAVVLVVCWTRRSQSQAATIAAIVAALWGFLAADQVARAVQHTRFQTEETARRETLTKPTVIAGFSLPAGTEVTHPDSRSPGAIENLQLHSPATLDGIPVIGYVTFLNGSPNGSVTLARNVTVSELPCAGGQSAQIDGARVTQCTLSRPAVIRGIPCSGYTIVDNGVVCELAADYRRYGYVWRKGTQINDTPGVRWTQFTIGRENPTPHVRGTPLAQGAVVVFQDGTIQSVDGKQPK